MGARRWWGARVNGGHVNLVRVNTLFNGVIIDEPGEYTVEFVYDAISKLTLIAVFLGGALAFFYCLALSKLNFFVYER